MAKKAYEEQFIANIATSIREKTGINKTYKTVEMSGGVNEVYEAGYENGYNSAVLSGTITVLENTKTLSISGLPKAPKELNLLSLNTTSPTNDNQYFIRGMDYDANGFFYGTSTLQRSSPYSCRIGISGKTCRQYLVVLASLRH